MVIMCVGPQHTHHPNTGCSIYRQTCSFAPFFTYQNTNKFKSEYHGGSQLIARGVEQATMACTRPVKADCSRCTWIVVLRRCYQKGQLPHETQLDVVQSSIEKPDTMQDLFARIAIAVAIAVAIANAAADYYPYLVPRFRTTGDVFVS